MCFLCLPCLQLQPGESSPMAMWTEALSPHGDVWKELSRTLYVLSPFIRTLLWHCCSRFLADTMIFYATDSLCRTLYLPTFHEAWRFHAFALKIIGVISWTQGAWERKEGQRPISREITTALVSTPPEKRTPAAQAHFDVSHRSLFALMRSVKRVQSQVGCKRELNSNDGNGVQRQQKEPRADNAIAKVAEPTAGTKEVYKAQMMWCTDAARKGRARNTNFLFLFLREQY